MEKKLENVAIAYYPETSKGHAIGVIVFQNGSDEHINAERVELDITYPTIYFRTDHKDKGLRLSNSKIQLWSLAHVAKMWEGRYPLQYDEKLKCYCINRNERRPYVRDESLSVSRLGQEVNYTPHYGTRASSPRALSKTIIINTADNKEIKPMISDRNEVTTAADGIRVSKDENWHKSAMNYLNKKVIDYLTSDRSADAKIIAEAIKVLQKEYRG